MALPTVAIRVEGGARIGMGHVFRCIALAHHLKSRFDIAFAVERYSKHAIQEIRRAGFIVEALPSTSDPEMAACQTIKWLRMRGVSVLLTDLYQVSPRYLGEIKRVVPQLPVVALDDFSIVEPIPDVIIKPHLVTEWYEPSSNNTTRVYTGVDYWILRPRLLDLLRAPLIVHRDVAKLLLNLGGSDPNGITIELARHLPEWTNNAIVSVVCGPAFPHIDALHQATKEDPRIRVLHTPSHFDRLMSDADLAITAGGYTAYELAALGTPSIVVPLVEHQTYHAKALQDKGVAIGMELYSKLDLDDFALAVRETIDDAERRQQMAIKGRALFDGRGAQRVAAIIANLI